jgi:hypothetical protein
MPENFLNSLAFIVCSMRALSDLFKDNILKFFDSLRGYVRVLTDAISRKNDVDEVLVFLCW